MILARFMLIFAAVIWGSSFVATKICLSYVNPVELLGLRLVIALPILYAIIAVKKVKFDLGTYRRPIFYASMVIMAHFFIQITGIKYTTATNTGWIIALIPLVVALLAFVFLKEKIRSNTIAGIVLATIGILFLISKGKVWHLSWLSSVGDWLVLASAHTWAIYTIITRDISRKLNPLVVTFSVLLPSGIVSLGIMSVSSDWSRFLHLPAEAIVSLFVLSVLATALGHWFWQDGVAKIGAAKAGVFLYLEPISTTAVAVPYLHEAFGLFTALGGGLVLFAVWLAQKQRKATEREVTVSEPA